MTPIETSIITDANPELQDGTYTLPNLENDGDSGGELMPKPATGTVIRVR